jgi:homocitrate synthase NifV
MAMIRIIDMTLSCLNSLAHDAEKLRELLALLLLTGADVIEMPSELYERLHLPPSPRYMLRIENPEEAERFSGINRFICRKNGFSSSISIVSELQINDVREINFLSRYENLKNVRIVGLDDVLCHDYENIFKNIKKHFKDKIEFCPENSLSCAAATAVEWVMMGGTDLVTSFGGIGNKAPLEEVLVSLKIAKRFRPNASYGIFPQIAELMEDILKEKYPVNKAVIGESIFNVESGIHIDGILKKPEMYEPFPPELVGGRRKFMIGKHSGKKAIRLKLSEHGIDPDGIKVAALLEEVRLQSVKRMSGLTDEEFLKLSELFKRRGE